MTQAHAYAAAESDGALSLELETLRRAAVGDSRAQAWLCRRVIGQVRRVCRALVRNTIDADDAAQLALIEVLRSAGSFRGESRLDSWAGRIAARTALRFVRRERRKAEAVVSDGERLASPESPPRLAENLPRHVQTYLDQLSEPQRVAIVLHHALGYSLDEVAQMQGVSPNTIKGRLRLGTASLRKLVRRDQKIGAPRGEG